MVLRWVVLGAVLFSGCYGGGYYQPRQPRGMLSGEMTQYQWQQRMGNDPTPPPALVGDSSIDDNTRWKLQHVQ